MFSRQARAGNQHMMGIFRMKCLGFVLFFLTIGVGEIEAQTCDYDAAVFSLVEGAPNRKITKDANYRADLVAIIVHISEEYNIDPMLMIATLYRESSFKMNVTGKIGEKGMGQVHGLAKRGCEMSTAYGQIDCAARWIHRMELKCGSVHGAVSAYLSGKCKPTGKVLAALRRRVSLARKLKNKFCR